MTGFRYLDGLAEIATHYGALACDAWGVIHNGRNLLGGSAEALLAFRREIGPVVILTNAPKPSSLIPGQLEKLGLPRDAFDAVVTSGDATRAEIEARLPAPAWRIGPPFDDPLFEGLAVDFVDPADAAFIICTGLDDGFNETPDLYEDRLAAAAARGLTMVCANPDIQVNWGGRLMWCAGALAQIYERAGGPVVYCGKPHPPIYALLEKQIRAAGGRGNVLAVGDGLETDILGANNARMDAILIAGDGGLHEGDAGRDSIDAKLRARGLSVVGIMEGLRW